MYTHADLRNLVEMAGVYRLDNGWQVVIRADWIDVTPQQPHGLSYAVMLQDERGQRLFGFDNAHAFDGASEDDRWDHEHRANFVGQRFRYDFVSGSYMFTVFYNKFFDYCALHGVLPEFIEDNHV